MLYLNPGKTILSCCLLLTLLISFQPAFTHPGDSLVNKLARTKKPEQQIPILHQLFHAKRYENFFEAEKCIMSAIDIGMKTGQSNLLIQSYCLLASLHEQAGNNMRAHLFYQEAQETALESDLVELLPELNYHIGVSLFRLNRYTEAITYLQHASLADSPRKREISRKAAIFLAFCFYETEREDKALKQFDSLIRSASKPEQAELLSFYYYELQNFWIERQEWLKALPLNEAALLLSSSKNNIHYTILTLRDRASIYQHLDSATRAIEFLRRALNGINIAGAFNYLKPKILDGLAHNYNLNDDHMLSQSYERQARMLRDSMSARGRNMAMPLQNISNPGMLPFQRTTVAGFKYWQNRLIPFILVVLASASGIIWWRYRKIKSNISAEKEAALHTARKVAEQEKEIALREAYQRLEKEKEEAMHEARGLVEKVQEEARSLQAQIAATSALLANKTEYLQQLQEKLYTTNNEDCRRFAKEIKSNIGDSDYWEEFIRNFDLLHQNTVEKITRKHPELTLNEVKLTCFILSGMNNKEIAGVFSVEPESVKKARYRLKKKLKLTEEESLRGYLEQLQ